MSQTNLIARIEDEGYQETFESLDNSMIEDMFDVLTGQGVIDALRDLQNGTWTVDELEDFLHQEKQEAELLT